MEKLTPLGKKTVRIANLQSRGQASNTEIQRIRLEFENYALMYLHRGWTKRRAERRALRRLELEVRRKVKMLTTGGPHVFG